MDADSAPALPGDGLLVQVEVRPAQQVVDVLVHGEPLQLGEEGEAKLVRHLGHLLDLRHADLLLDGVRVEEVAAEDQRVLRGVDGVDPAGGDEERVARLQFDLVYVHVELDA